MVPLASTFSVRHTRSDRVGGSHSKSWILLPSPSGTISRRPSGCQIGLHGFLPACQASTFPVRRSRIWIRVEKYDAQATIGSVGWKSTRSPSPIFSGPKTYLRTTPGSS
jgi:hypothetical protein